MRKTTERKKWFRYVFVGHWLTILLIQFTTFGVMQIQGTMLQAQTTEKNGSMNSTDAECRIIENLFYKNGSNLSEYEKERCFLDLYLPKDRMNFPVLVWFHGGSLKRLSKEHNSTQAIGKHFAQNGVAVAIANYRLSPMATYPSYIEDAAACVGWVIDHIKEYGGDPRAVFISGHSAGGYLAYMLAMDHKYLDSVGVRSDEIAGIIPIGGQTFTHYAIREERGLPNPEKTPVIDEASPCFHARKDAPPVLALYSDGDSQDRIEENHYLIALLKEIGHPDAEYREIKDRTHWTLITKIPNPDDPVAEAIMAFIAKHGPSDQ